jgi:hypothetical protein
LVTPLELVYPPFTNQEAEWLANDPATVEQWRQGSIYMIAMRAEATFVDFTFRGWTNRGPASLRATLAAGDLREAFEIDFDILFDHHGLARVDGDELRVDVGEKIIRILVGTPEAFDSDTADLVDFFTTEKLIYDRGRLHPAVGGLSSVRKFATYDLLYVGIAGGSDVYERLVNGAHHGRQKILSNEHPRSPGARVTDEVILFVFTPRHFAIKVFGDVLAFSEPTPAEVETHRRAVVADAEKAFIKLLDPAYNVQKYHRYPEGADGLHAQGLAGYGFVINENLTFRTGSTTFRGATRVIRQGPREEHLLDNRADSIVVRGDLVTLHQGEPDPM